MPSVGPFGFMRGWNTKASVTTLPENSMSDAQNVNIVYGDLVKRAGSKTINSSAISGTPAIHGLADWSTAAGQRSLVVTAGAQIFKTNDLGTTLTDISGAVTITSGQNNQSTFASLNNIIVRCGGATPDAPIKWSGTGNAAALGGSPPTGRIVAVANNFMFISGIAATPSRVFWSNVIDPETWPAANYVDFRISDGDIVTAICEMNQNLIIFKRRSIGQLWTIPPSTAASVTLGPLIQTIVGIGTPGAQCVDKLDDGRLVFLGTNAHVYIFDGSTTVDISDPQPPAGSIQPTLDALNIGRLQYAVVRFYPTRREIWVSVSEGSSSTNNAIYIYNLEYGCWESKFTGIAANVMCSSLDTRTTPSHPIIMVTGNYAGRVYEQDTGNTNAEDANTVIDGYGTISLFMNSSSRDFLPKSAMVPLKNQTATMTNLEFNYGFNDLTATIKSNLVSQSGSSAVLDSFVLDASTLDSSGDLFRKTPIVTTGQVYSLVVQLRNRQSGQDFRVHPFYVSDEVII